MKPPPAFLFTDKRSCILSVSQSWLSLSVCFQLALVFPLWCTLTLTPLCNSLLWFCFSSLQPCLRPWPQRLPGAGGWQWPLSSRICCSPPCCWDGGLSSSCSSQKASTLTFATLSVSHNWWISVLTKGLFQLLQYCLYLICLDGEANRLDHLPSCGYTAETFPVSCISSWNVLQLAVKTRTGDEGSSWVRLKEGAGFNSRDVTQHCCLFASSILWKEYVCCEGVMSCF